MAFVPEGQADRSQARSAWVAMQRGPVPEGRSKSLSVPQIFVVETELMPLQKRLVHLFNRPAGTGFFLMIPGTSCLATISLSLRDKNHPPIEVLRIILALVGFTRTCPENAAGKGRQKVEARD